ncbi:hypothetical protein S40288_03729 [Stachybotrys chartarum IBT 40288]|nr:hypothetical protein S40288_03729 [Stachybotrys chartarum IBT 40288]
MEEESVAAPTSGQPTAVDPAQLDSSHAVDDAAGSGREGAGAGPGAAAAETEPAGSDAGGAASEAIPGVDSRPPLTTTTSSFGHESRYHDQVRHHLTQQRHQHYQPRPQQQKPASLLQASPPSDSVPNFVAPLSYLRPKPLERIAMNSPPNLEPPSPLDKEQAQGLKAIRDFLKVRTSYDVLPLSFRLIVLDTDLLIKKTLNILIQNAIVSAPLWDSHTGRFAGLLTSTDYINVVQYYWQFPDEMSKLDQFRLSSLRDIEKAINASPIETVSVHPSRPLYEACQRMLSTRARRIPLVDVDDETGQETVVSVITQYRILKFIAVNNEPNTILLKKTIRELRLGSYDNLATATMKSSVLDAIGLMVRHNISCIPVVDEDRKLLNAFEAVDVIPCLKSGDYEELKGTVGEALCLRPEDIPGIYTCTEEDRLDSIFETIRKSRVHRLIVVDDENRLKGVISLSDILKYVLIQGEEDVAF